MAGRDSRKDPDVPYGERQRLDKWLWFARVVKSRALATKLVEAGHVRLNGARAAGPDKPVRKGDVLTIALERQVRVLRVEASGERRGPYEEARLLYTDLSEGLDAGRLAPDPDATL